jgi:hypothetical protein
MGEANQIKPTPPIPELVGDILSDVQKLVRQEAALLLAQAKEEARDAKKMATLLTSSTVCAAIAAVFIAVALVKALTAIGLPDWASFGTVALLLFATAFAMTKIALKPDAETKPTVSKTKFSIYSNQRV